MRVPTLKIRAASQATARMVPNMRATASSTCHHGGAVMPRRRSITRGELKGKREAATAKVESGARCTANMAKKEMTTSSSTGWAACCASWSVVHMQPTAAKSKA